MACVIYMPDVPFSVAHQSPHKESYASAQATDSRQPFWDCLPPDTLAIVASHLKSSYVAAARQTCKAWRHGISRGVTTLAPNVQSPAGNRTGSVASYYLYAALRWQDIPQLLAVFNSCRTLDLRNATVSLGCVDLLSGAASLECLRLRSDYFTSDKDGSKHEELTKFIALLPATVQKIELDLRWDTKEFLAALDTSAQQLKALPPAVEVDSLYVSTPEFLPRHMDGIAAFQGLKVLQLDRQTMKAETMDSAAFSRLGELTELEELMLAMQLTEVDGEGFMMGLGPLHHLRRLECFGVERMSDSVIEALWEQWKHLGSLRLTNCKSLTDRALHRMAVLPSLYNMFLSGNQNFSHSLMSSVKQRIKLATFRQCGDLSVCVYGSLPSPGS